MRREQLHIPQPCSASWEAMHGDDQRRFCDHCSKHVHDLSAMDEASATALLQQEPSLCVRFSVAPDGSVRHRPTRRWPRLVAAAASLLSAVPALASPAPIPEAEAPDAPGWLEWARDQLQQLTSPDEMIVGQLSVQDITTQGEVVEPPPPPPPPEHPVVMGRIAGPHVVPLSEPQPPEPPPVQAPPTIQAPPAVSQPPLPPPAPDTSVIPEVQEALDRQR